ncbi:non-specific serine/threonine protein kinase [Prosthecobacter fusiformis]|uniref:Non-specific serine/threonine protein kinase n=1 Tax=Prosthecobacter fusiformis TaxID=48464 RepID=A0A4R7SQN4_9BACT|nr:DEAD/DEAH box helicase [Prosthecobacter fusiformis]TDU81572.1 non-specific serine/threonine protein kinase [Prosthecobacter fusiformis]
MLQPVLTPDGLLLTEGEAVTGEERQILALSREGPGALLIGLGTGLLLAEVEMPWRWLRSWAQLFLTRLCQTKDVRMMPVPEVEQRRGMMAKVPPFPGVESLSPEMLEQWWLGMAGYVAQKMAGHAGGLEGWLKEANPAWHVVGRVTFHLAENKTDPQRPFAFLATFTEKLSASGQVQHLPLARALQMYSGQKDQAAMQALLEPVRTAAAQSALLREWLETRRLFQPLALDPQEAYRWLRDSHLFQESGIVVKLPNWWREGKGTRPTVQVTIDAPQEGGGLHAGGMLSFRVDKALQGSPLTEAEWEKLLSAETGLVSLRGQWVEVQGAKLQQVIEHWTRVQNAVGEGLIGFLDGMRLLARYVPKATAEEAADAETLYDWSDIVAGKGLAEVLEKMLDPAQVEPPANLRATLRPYQQKGLAWLHFMTRLGLGACLADDMGLGKTLQVIALLLLRQGQVKEPALLVVPASLVGNWQGEVAKFAPDLKLRVAHPSVMERQDLDRLVRSPAAMLKGCDVMLTTYTFLQRTESWQMHPWSLVILDEAQAIKNPASGSTQAVKRLQAPCRIALTGTPIENRPGDLWSLFDFLNPGLLGPASVFAQVVKQCATGRDGYAPLRRLVQPYILRRMKTDKSVITDLPEKTEVKAWCGLTKRQTTIYAKLVDQMAKLMADATMDPIRRQGLVLSFLIQFKQVCNHPSHWNGDGVWGGEDSGKFNRLAEICSQIAERRERVLVFTQFQETCDPLARFLARVFGREGLVLHGGTPVKKRPQLVDAFQQPDGPPFMVISVKAGGTGLTLTAASHVIHFDRWWNPAIENQATDRAFRIGQKKNVLVHKFICQGTIEQRIDALLEKKTALSDALLSQEGSAESLLTEMSTEELLHFVSLDVNAALG